MPGRSGAHRVHTTFDTPLGELTLIREGERIAGLYFPHHWYLPPQSSFGPRVDDGFDVVTGQLTEYFAGQRQHFELPMLLAGTSPQIAVWRLLSRIPYGRTTTYASLARDLDLGIPARDVGKLIGRNPLCILVPCHRVIGASSDLTGYAGGLTRKRELLELEGAVPMTPQLTLPLDKGANMAGQRPPNTGLSESPLLGPTRLRVSGNGLRVPTNY
jgi:methylated-DNA-[protein]-cysteine S-methyltransferase